MNNDYFNHDPQFKQKLNKKLCNFSTFLGKRNYPAISIDNV